MRCTPAAGSDALRWSVIVAIATGGFACADGGRPGEVGERRPATRTDVVLTLDRDGPGGARPRSVRIRCDERSTRPACRDLRQVPADVLRPLPPDAICTQIYGGPAVGRIRGSIAGRRVDARYARTNGCEIARFDRVAPLLRMAR